MKDRPARPGGDGSHGPGSRLALGTGVFAFGLSLALYLYTLSPSLSIVAAAALIAGGEVGRRRAMEPAARVVAYAAMAGGATGAVVALVLAALGA